MLTVESGEMARRSASAELDESPSPKRYYLSSEIAR